MRKKIVVLLSGGLDSTTLVYYFKQFRTHTSYAEYELEYDVHALAVDYGQKHAAELRYAVQVAKTAEIPFVVVPMSEALQEVFAEAKSSQVGRNVEVPIGHYADENMKTTIVPNRNMLLLAIAGAYAVSIEASAVAYAAHAGDHAIYPDCRPAFMESMRTSLVLGAGVDLICPFARKTKTEIVAIGNELGVPFHLTYSCYNGKEYAHCGKCGTCFERREAFREAGVSDPTKYD